MNSLHPRFRRRLEAINPDLLGLPTVSEFERENGLGQSAFSNWARRRLVRFGKYRLVPPDLAREYHEATRRPNIERVARRPSGYIGLYAALAEIGCDEQWIWKQVRIGNCRAVRRGYINLYHREDVRRLGQEYRNLPPPGWEQVAPFVKARNGDTHTTLRRIRALGHECRRFRSSKDRQYVWFARPEGLAAWGAYMDARDQAKNDPRTCPECGAGFSPLSGGQHGRFCSKRCYNLQHYRLHGRRKGAGANTA